MIQAANAVQRVIYEAITSAVPAKVKVFDYVPESESVPYIGIGTDKLELDGTKTGRAYSVECEVHIIDKKTGFKNIKKLSGDVVAALENINRNMLGYNVRFFGDESIEFEQLDEIDAYNEAVVRMTFRAAEN